MNERNLDLLRTHWEMIEIKQFSDGTIAGIVQFIYTYAIISEVRWWTYGRRWCYADLQTCRAEFEDWTHPEREPNYFIKAVHTGERRNEQNETVGFY